MWLFIRTQGRHAETGIGGRMRRLTGEKAAHPSYQLKLDESSRGKEDEISIFSDHVYNLDSNELLADMFGRSW
jgi:hypothetical protein